MNLDPVTNQFWFDQILDNQREDTKGGQKGYPLTDFTDEQHIGSDRNKDHRDSDERDKGKEWLFTPDLSLHEVNGMLFQISIDTTA